MTLYDSLQTLESHGEVLKPLERLRAIERPLLSWYHSHARILPWREDPRPYRVWISEIMLQQTRVEAVKPYFERFMKALPDVRELAEIEEDVLLKLWEGLGYYNRARNLKKAAQIIMDRYNGEFPGTCEELLELPGIGSYTAGAVCSIAFGVSVPAVDGNVLRVISRVTGSRADILKQQVKRQMEDQLALVIPEKDPGSYNQGLMEIGAMVCLPNGAPLCEECPLSSLCVARRDGLTGEIPVKTPKKPRRIEERTVFLLEMDGKYAIRKRPDTGLLASLYELPGAEGYLDREEVAVRFLVPVEAVEELPGARHIFTHVEWQMIGYRIPLMEESTGDFLWVWPEEIKKIYSLPNAFKTYTKMIR